MVSNFEELGGRLLVIFDGRCGLCNRAVRWFLRRDRQERLRFVASESPKVAGLLERHKMGTPGSGSGSDTTLRTVLVALDPDGPGELVLARSDAVLALLSELPSPWPAVAAALRWIPPPVRDLGYRLIARWRYRIWGRFESCPIPTVEERKRFL
jgi:predicted DCC family thiol-disulfide oxidoreductase YuxK